MSLELKEFTKESKKHTSGFYEFLAESAWINIKDNNFHTYRYKLIQQVNKLQGYLSKQEEKYKRQYSYEDSLKKNSKSIKETL